MMVVRTPKITGLATSIGAGNGGFDATAMRWASV